MANINSYSDNRFADTDIFVVMENGENDCDFVTIDEDLFPAPIIIDMSDDEFAEAITVDFEENTDFNDFVTIDNNPIFISGFTGNDDL
jgi:hypothetical protein